MCEAWLKDRAHGLERQDWSHSIEKCGLKEQALKWFEHKERKTDDDQVKRCQRWREGVQWRRPGMTWDDMESGER